MVNYNYLPRRIAQYGCKYSLVKNRIDYVMDCPIRLQSQSSQTKNWLRHGMRNMNVITV